MGAYFPDPPTQKAVAQSAMDAGPPIVTAAIAIILKYIEVVNELLITATLFLGVLWWFWRLRRIRRIEREALESEEEDA